MNDKNILDETVNEINKKQGKNALIKASEITSKIDKAPKGSTLGSNNNYCLNNVSSSDSLSENKELSRGENVFNKLYAINVNEHIEKKNNLSYLSWTYAWAEAKKRFPTLTYKIHLFGERQLPYVYDENTGYMVFTDVTVDGLTHSMWLPVMDGANKAMKNEAYTYEVDEYGWINGRRSKTGKKIKKTVEPATMFDINKTIMRCLVKNLAMFGLGLYIYAGEDLPEIQEEIKEVKEEKKENADDKTLNLLISEIEKYNGQAEQLKRGILTKYKVKNLLELSEQQANQAINKLKNFRKKEEKSNDE